MYSSAVVKNMLFVKKKTQLFDLPFPPGTHYCSNAIQFIMLIFTRKCISSEVYTHCLTPSWWFIIFLNHWSTWNLMETRVVCMFTEKGNHERRILNCHLLSSGKVQNLIQRRETKHILKPRILCLPITLICITHKLHRSPSNVQLQEQSLFWP